MTQNEKEEQNAVDDWNTMNEVGCKVLVRKDEQGDELETTTKYPAQMLCGTAVIFVHGISGAYMLSRVRAMKPCINCSAMIVEPFPFETGSGEPVCDDCGRELNLH